MRNIILVIICVLALGLTTTNAMADIKITDPQYVGVITPDGGSPATEIGYIDILRLLSPDGSTTSGTFPHVQTYERSSNIFSPALPDPNSLTFEEVTTNLSATFTVNGYVLAKYDHANAGAYVWYFDAPTTITLPADLGTCGSGGCGLSHYIYNQASVPDGGVTLMLLGGVLVGLETLRRRLSA